MKKILYLQAGVFSIFLTVCSASLAQTGPGGVGNSGSNDLWLRADGITGVGNGQRVTTWNDLSGNGNNASQSQTSLKPKYYTNKINSLPAVYFNGTANYMTCGTNLTGNDASIFIVMNKPGVQNKYRFVLLTEKNHIASRFQNSGDKWGTYFNGEFPTSVTLNGSYSILSSLTDGVGMTVSMYTNGGSLTSSPILSFKTKPVTTIGAHYNGSKAIYFALMNLAEVIHYNSVVNSAQRIIIENYLGAKYGIAISNDKYAYQAVHSFELAGIGREDASNENTDAQGSGIVRINTASSLDDGDYLLFAHDNGLLGTTGTDVPITYTMGQRLIRTWRAGETGEAGTVTLTVDMTGITFGDPNNYELLIDADGVFAAGASSQTADSYNPVTHVLTFLNVNLNDGDYFTIGNPNSDIISVQTGTWDDPNTWNCTCVPDSIHSPTIDNTHTVTIDANAKAYSVKINPTGTLTTSGSVNFRILGDLYVDGVFTPGSGTVICPGGSAQTFTNNTASTISFSKLDIRKSANSVTLAAGNFEITDVLDISGGTFDPAGFLTLVSDASATARIAPTSTGSITGNMIIQRYASSRDADWADIACPVTGTTLSDWDQEIYMSGVGGIDGDACCPLFRSVWEYNESTTKYDSLTSVATVLSPGQGYELFLGSDMVTWNAGTFDSRGIPVTGDQVMTVTRTGGDGWNLLGNPFASYISWTSISNDIAFGNIDDNFSIYDAATQNYITYGDGDEIPAHQGFWVHSSSGSPTMTIREAHKTTTTTSTFHKKAPDYNTLVLKVSNKMNYASHQTKIKFRDQASYGFDKSDALYKESKVEWAPGLLTLNSDNDRLTWNALPQNTDEVEIPLDIDCGLSGYYTIDASGIESLEHYNCVLLEDLQTNQLIDLTAIGSYTFYSEKNKGSEHNYRFIIHLSDQRICETGISENEDDVKIYSDGTDIFIQFGFSELTNADITVFDITGRIIMHRYISVTGEKIKLESGDLDKGVYLVHIQTPQKTLTSKIEINNLY